MSIQTIPQEVLEDILSNVCHQTELYGQVDRLGEIVHALKGQGKHLALVSKLFYDTVFNAPRCWKTVYDAYGPAAIAQHGDQLLNKISQKLRLHPSCDVDFFIMEDREIELNNEIHAYRAFHARVWGLLLPHSNRWRIVAGDEATFGLLPNLPVNIPKATDLGGLEDLRWRVDRTDNERQGRGPWFPLFGPGTQDTIRLPRLHSMLLMTPYDIHTIYRLLAAMDAPNLLSVSMGKVTNEDDTPSFYDGTKVYQWNSQKLAQLHLGAFGPAEGHFLARSNLPNLEDLFLPITPIYWNYDFRAEDWPERITLSSFVHLGIRARSSTYNLLNILGLLDIPHLDVFKVMDPENWIRMWVGRPHFSFAKSITMLVLNGEDIMINNELEEGGLAMFLSLDNIKTLALGNGTQLQKFCIRCLGRTRVPIAGNDEILLPQLLDLRLSGDPSWDNRMNDLLELLRTRETLASRIEYLFVEWNISAENRDAIRGLALDVDFLY